LRENKRNNLFDITRLHWQNTIIRTEHRIHIDDKLITCVSGRWNAEGETIWIAVEISPIALPSLSLTSSTPRCPNPYRPRRDISSTATSLILEPNSHLIANSGCRLCRDDICKLFPRGQTTKDSERVHLLRLEAAPIESESRCIFENGHSITSRSDGWLGDDEWEIAALPRLGLSWERIFPKYGPYSKVVCFFPDLWGATLVSFLGSNSTSYDYL
jgi:hypothetical protein